MPTVRKFALAAAFIGLLPFSSFFLVPLELVMIYRLSVLNRRPFSIVEFGFIAIVCALGTVMRGWVAFIFTFLGPLGWLAKAVIAGLFVLLFGWLVNQYYQSENMKQTQR